MTSVTTTVREGRIKVDEPTDLANGSQVEVMFHPKKAEVFGMSEEEQGTTPEEIERWIATLEAIPAPVMSDADWSAWMTRRREDRERELSHEKEREATLFGDS